MLRTTVALLLTILPMLTVVAQPLSATNDGPPPADDGRPTGRMDSVQHVGEVVVTSKLVFREVMPSQKLTGEQLYEGRAMGGRVRGN